MFYNSSIVPENSNPDLLGAQISHGRSGFFVRAACKCRIGYGRGNAINSRLRCAVFFSGKMRKSGVCYAKKYYLWALICVRRLRVRGAPNEQA